jgi:beta-xylosidase
MAALPASAWQSDNGDGSYTNPPLNADYPDPDVIRVDEDFYFATTTFANSPGLRILHSRDLVNWRIAGHVLPRLEGGKAFNLEGGNVYRRGVFAPSLRFHKGEFIIAFTMVGQHTRICRAALVSGPWRCESLDREAFDPGLFFHSDGSAHIATAIGSDGTVTLLSLNAELTQVTEARKVHYIPGAEGSKLVRRGDWYYLFNVIPRAHPRRPAACRRGPSSPCRASHWRSPTRPTSSTARNWACNGRGTTTRTTRAGR